MGFDYRLIPKPGCNARDIPHRRLLEEKTCGCCFGKAKYSISNDRNEKVVYICEHCFNVLKDVFDLVKIEEENHGLQGL